VFGTLVEVSVYGENEAHARQGITAVMQEFQRLHDMLHAWKPSELSELNAAFAHGNSKIVSPELAAILKDAAQLSEQSGGTFNPTIGGLIQVWGFQADDFKAVLPDEKKITALVKANPQMSDLVFSNPNPPQPSLVREGAPTPPLTRGGREGFEIVGSRNRSVQLDLGGYAKGYALDRAAAILKQQGIHHALINIGGNVLALGQHGKRPWRVGIQHPRKPGALATLELQDGEAIGTSGDYQRYFEMDGKRYCHVIDPRTGQTVPGVQAVTILIRPLAIRLMEPLAIPLSNQKTVAKRLVIGEQTSLTKSLVMTRGVHAGVLSDAASKPLFVSGAAGWRAAAHKMQLDEALLIDSEGAVHLTAAMQKRLEFTDSKTVRTIEP